MKSLAKAATKCMDQKPKEKESWYQGEILELENSMTQLHFHKIIITG